MTIEIKDLESNEIESYENIGELSDGHHTFNQLYEHRCILFSVICNQNPDISWKSRKHNDGSMFEGYFVVGIMTPKGQATYHYKTNKWNVFNIDEIAYAPVWDGHTPEEAIKRISLLEKRNNKMENKIVFTSFGFIQANEVLKFCTFNGVEFAKIKYIDGHGVAEIEVKTINGKVNLYGGETIIKTEKGLEVIK
jgi:hypothetical protein